MAIGWNVKASMAARALDASSAINAARHGALRTPSQFTSKDVRDAKPKCYHVAYGRTTSRINEKTKTHLSKMLLMINKDAKHVANLATVAVGNSKLRL